MGGATDLLGRTLRAVAKRRQIAAMARLNCRDQPESRRKSYLHRCLDLLYLLVRKNDLSPLYYAQQVDLKGRSVRRDYLTYGHFRTLRDTHNGMAGRSGRYNYGCLLDDKLLFERYFAAGGIPVPRSLGLVQSDGAATFFGVADDADLSEIALRHCPDQDLFVKPRFGIKGKGVFKVRFSEQGIAINGKPASRDSLREHLSRSCLVQQVIPQHPEIAQLHPQSLNTIRVISVRTEGDIKIFLAYLRMAGGGAIADNNGVSRAVVRVDLDSGRLAETGFSVSGEVAQPVRHHPDTGVAFSNVRIPDFQRCVDTVKAAHGWLPGLNTVGWDVAVTPDGPLLLEGNDDWGSSLAMFVDAEFVARFTAVTSAGNGRPDRR